MPDRYLVEEDRRRLTATGRQTGGCWFPLGGHDTEAEAEAAMGDALIDGVRRVRVRRVWPGRDAGGSEVLTTMGG